MEKINENDRLFVQFTSKEHHSQSIKKMQNFSSSQNISTNHSNTLLNFYRLKNLIENENNRIPIKQTLIPGHPKNADHWKKPTLFAENESETRWKLMKVMRKLTMNTNSFDSLKLSQP